MAVVWQGMKVYEILVADKKSEKGLSLKKVVAYGSLSRLVPKVYIQAITSNTQERINESYSPHKIWTYRKTE